MTVPYYMSETKSDMRGIKHGWYAIEDDGTLYSGPFPSFEECARENHIFTDIRRWGRRRRFN